MMRCTCGAQPEYGGEARPDNGRICWECEAFTCSRCFAEFEKLGTTYADRDLCPTCNTAPEPVSLVA